MQRELWAENLTQLNSQGLAGNQKAKPKPPLPEGMDGSVAGRRKRGKQRTPTEKRFWEKVRKSNNGCWLWVGAKDRDGYGLFRSGYKEDKEHRAAHWAWIFSRGRPIPPDMMIFHICDNPPCVRPSHIFLGDAQVNMDDKMRKGRYKGQPPGQESSNAKLTDLQVLEIRRLCAMGMTQRSVAHQFGVGYKAINKIVLRQRWRHLP